MYARIKNRILLPAALTLAPLAPGLLADTTTNFNTPNGTWTITTDITDEPNKIKIEFQPDADAVNCSKIVFVQTVKRYLDGVLVPTPSAVTSKWFYKDDDTVAGTGVDHLFCEKDPGYNGDDTQDGGQQGSAAGDGSATTSSKMSDSPHYPDSTFNRTGKTSVRLEFETCAICMEGPQAGTNYGCITWKYERSKGDADKGTSTLTSAAVAAPSAAFTAALAAFTANHTFAGEPICPEELPAGDCGNRVYLKKGPLTFKVNDNYQVDIADAGVKKGASPGNINTPVRSGDSVAPCEYVHVPKGKRVCLTRKAAGGGVAPPGTNPFSATFVSVFQGEMETVETGFCQDLLHCGTMIQNAEGLALAIAAPEDEPSGDGFLMYTAHANVADQTVTFRNDPLSTHGLFVDNLLAPQMQLLFPGQEVTYFYAGELFPPHPPEPGLVVCAGDGSGSACPCANDSPTAGAGCVHSGGLGMSIRGEGTASVFLDDLVLFAEDCPMNNSGIFYVGTVQLTGGNPLYEGLQCAAGDVRRFGGQFQTDGIASDGNFVAQDPSGIYFVPGGSYYFQYWSRDVQTQNHGCPTAPGIGANFSPAYCVQFVP